MSFSLSKRFCYCYYIIDLFCNYPIVLLFFSLVCIVLIQQQDVTNDVIQSPIIRLKSFIRKNTTIFGSEHLVELRNAVLVMDEVRK